MKNLFDRTNADELTQRIDRVGPGNAALWGKMTASQALAHCAIAMEWAVGETRAPRMFIGRIIGGMVKKKVVNDDAPLGKSSPTAPSLIIKDERVLAAERDRLRGLVQRFATAGPKGCTSNPHTFFGPMTPDEWAVLMYKHIDHHLRQFGA